MSSELIKVGQIEIRYLVDGAKKGGLGVFEMTVPAGAIVPPPHSHTANEECVYVLEGTLHYSVDGVSRDLEPGDWMSTPRGSTHHFINKTDAAVRALVRILREERMDGLHSHDFRADLLGWIAGRRVASAAGQDRKTRARGKRRRCFRLRGRDGRSLHASGLNQRHALAKGFWSSHHCDGQ